MRRFCFLLLLLSLVGCEQRISDDDDSSSGDFLRLQAFTLVEPAEGSLQGFLRWLYLEEDPSQVEEPAVRCEVWEELNLTARAPDDSCSDCDYQFEGRATVEEGGSTTCEDVDWNERDFSLAFGPLWAFDSDVTALGEEGYSHAVQSRWSPDLGESEGFQLMFAAEPKVWAPDEGGGVLGSGVDDVLSGQHELLCLYFWELD